MISWMISQSFIAAAAIWRIKWFVLQDRSGLHIEMNSGLITFFSDAQKYQKIRNAKTICRVWFMDMIHWCQALPVNPPPPSTHKDICCCCCCVLSRECYIRLADHSTSTDNNRNHINVCRRQPSRPSGTRWFQQACVSSQRENKKLGDVLL